MQLQGYVDYLDIKRVSGWVIDLDNPKEVVRVRIMLDDRLLGIVPADRERSDLLAAGIPRGNCMFVFRFAQPLAASDLPFIQAVPENSEQPLSGSLHDFQRYCAAKFFPYHETFEYSWWDTRCFQTETDMLSLEGDMHLPGGASHPVFSLNGGEPVEVKLGLQTHGRARDFWYVENSQMLGYQATVAVDKSEPFNDVWLRYQDSSGQERIRPIVRFPSDRSRERLIPPPEMLTRVIGPTPRPYGSFIVGGATDVLLIEFLLEKYTRRKASEFGSVLDWGCGCGRTTWALAEMLPDANLIGIDIDEPNLNYARSIVPGANFELSGLYPPLRLRNSTGDLIFSQSVFTHLSETAQDLWLAELDRILAPGGVAIISLQLEVTSLARSFDVEAIQTYQAFGIEDYIRDRALGGVISDEDYYRSTFHTTDYVKKRWQKVFHIAGIEPGFVGGHQDAVICLKKDGPR
jgi:SAM-dependent methyltransferase